jgi:hypothetical protein
MMLASCASSQNTHKFSFQYYDTTDINIAKNKTGYLFQIDYVANNSINRSYGLYKFQSKQFVRKFNLDTLMFYDSICGLYKSEGIQVFNETFYEADSIMANPFKKSSVQLYRMNDSRGPLLVDSIKFLPIELHTYVTVLDNNQNEVLASPSRFFADSASVEAYIQPLTGIIIYNPKNYKFSFVRGSASDLFHLEERFIFSCSKQAEDKKAK